MAANPVPVARDPQAAVFARAVCLSLSTAKFGNSRKVATSVLSVDADKNRLHVTKKLLAAEELEAIARFDRALRQAIEAESLPLPRFAGSYVVPLPSVEKIEALLRDAVPARAALVQKAAEVYPEKIREASEALRVVFSERDYPSVERFRVMYLLEWRWIAIDTPGQLRQVSTGFFREEREKAARYWSEMLEEGKQLLRETFLELVRHARERLEPGADGKPKVFRNTMLENLNGFLETFNVRNIADDQELGRLVEQMRTLAGGVRSQDLRSQEALRGAWAQEVAKIETRLNAMVADKPGRRITLD